LLDACRRRRQSVFLKNCHLETVNRPAAFWETGIRSARFRHLIFALALSFHELTMPVYRVDVLQRVSYSCLTRVLLVSLSQVISTSSVGQGLRLASQEPGAAGGQLSGTRDVGLRWRRHMTLMTKEPRVEGGRVKEPRRRHYRIRNLGTRQDSKPPRHPCPCPSPWRTEGA